MRFFRQIYLLIWTGTIFAGCTEQVKKELPSTTRPPPSSVLSSSPSPHPVPSGFALSSSSNTIVSAPSLSASASRLPPLPPLGGIGITVPASIKTGERRPFVLYLHGLGASGKILVDAMKIASLAEEKRFIYAAPDGAMDKQKRRFWNAWAACCDMDHRGIDHVGALRMLIKQAKELPQVDPSKIFVVGFSNGGFMAHRLACEVDEITGIASMAGAGPGEGEICTPKHPVTVLQVHGDADKVIDYQGGQALKDPSLPMHPSALKTVEDWAKLDACTSSSPAKVGTLDFEEKLPGEETTMTLFAGCKKPVALWTVHGGSHFIGSHRKGQEAIFNYLEKNSR